MRKQTQRWEVTLPRPYSWLVAEANFGPRLSGSSHQVLSYPLQPLSEDFSCFLRTQTHCKCLMSLAPPSPIIPMWNEILSSYRVYLWSQDLSLTISSLYSITVILLLGDQLTSFPSATSQANLCPYSHVPDTGLSIDRALISWFSCSSG